jgi:hypothetical protein
VCQLCKQKEQTTESPACCQPVHTCMWFIKGYFPILCGNDDASCSCIQTDNDLKRTNLLEYLYLIMYNMSNLTMVETVCSHVLVCFSEWSQGKLVASLPRSPRKKMFVSPCACASAWARAAETL